MITLHIDIMVFVKDHYDQVIKMYIFVYEIRTFDSRVARKIFLESGIRLLVMQASHKLPNCLNNSISTKMTDCLHYI